MSERPILFSDEMVRAILAGRKTQTRRVVRGVGAADYAGATWVADGDLHTPARDELCRGCLDAIGPAVRCPYGAPGDRLWVRETWAAIDDRDDTVTCAASDIDQERDRLVYRATDHTIVRPWRSPIHMPRWASRITLEVTAVRAERLQDITEEDARAEGVTSDIPGVWNGSPRAGRRPRPMPSAREAFADLWDDINHKRAPWESNPWVWRIELRRLEP